jgi:uncharacterized glyoxalase superfamily protein PhnB
MIQFKYTILYVGDVEQTVSFYEIVFGFKRIFITPDGSYGEIETGGTTLSFASHAQAKSNLGSEFIQSSPEHKPFGIEIGFTTVDVESLYNKAIEAGAHAVSPAQLKPHGQTVAYVRDPDGFLIEICTSMS